MSDAGLAGQTVLVTGAAGFVGQRVCARLRPVFGRVIGLDRATGATKRQDFDADRLVSADLTDRPAVDGLFESERIAAVVHCGGISGAMLARDDPALMYRVNVMGTVNVLDAAARHRVFRFVHASSIAVYGDHPSIDAVDESVAPQAVDPYGTSKIASELIARSYRASRLLDVVALRFASIYGPGRRTECVIGALYASTLTGQPARVGMAANNPRQLVYVDDCVEAVANVLAVRGLPQFAYNIATGRIHLEEEVARLAAGIDSRVRYQRDPARRFSDGQMGALDVTAARRDFGFVARVDLEQGLRRYWSRRAGRLSDEAG